MSGAGITLIFSGGETNAQVTFEVSATGSGSGDDVTTSTVRAAGALMDDELDSPTHVKAVDQSVESGASPTFGTANFTDASNKRLMTDAQESKLDGIEASADVTDATNVTSAGALMDSELTSIADVKALNQSLTTSANPTFAGVSAAGVSADIVDVGDVIKFTSGMTAASIVTTVNGVSGDVTLVTTDQNFTDDDHTKLDGIEASADVTDTDNVQAAVTSTHLHVAGVSSNGGATFAGTVHGEKFFDFDHGNDTGINLETNDVISIEVAGTQRARILSSGTEIKGPLIAEEHIVAGKGISFDTAGGITFADGSGMTTAAGATHTDQNFTVADHSKLDGIEASADVTDAANVTSAGALMDSELTSIADVKALDQSVVSGASPTFGTANFTDASNKRLMTDAQESKLDGIEASADVTDATNVTSAGALMDSELTSIADVKALDQSVVSGANPVFTFISALAGISVGAGGITFPDGTHQATAAPRTGSYTGQIETVADKTYTIDPGAATDRTITGFYIKSASGTVTATLKNGADTVKAASVTDATGDQTGLANTSVSANGVLTLVTSSNSSALDVIFAVEYTE